MTDKYIITTEELKKLRNSGKLMIVDVRERERYEKGHLQGAVSHPYRAGEMHPGEAAKDRIIVFYCERGNRSMKAMMETRRAGYQSYSLAGGYESLNRFQK